jgi:hypothetical protein
MVYGEEKNTMSPTEPTKEGTLSFVLFESPFTSVSTVSRGHLSLVSLIGTETNRDKSHHIDKINVRYGLCAPYFFTLCS